MSGSVEEQNVERESVASPLRRIRAVRPARDAFGPSGAEISALGLLNQQGGPQLVGFLSGIQSDRLQAQDAYANEVRAANETQAELGRLAAIADARDADDRMIRAGMQYGDRAAAFPRVMRLAGEEGTPRLLGLFEDARAFRQSQTAENNAQAARAVRGGGGTNAPAELPPAQVRGVLNDANRAGETAMRAYLSSIRAPNSFILSNGTPLPVGGTAPFTDEQRATALRLRDEARAAHLRNLSAADPRIRTVIERMQETPVNSPQASVPALPPAQVDTRAPANAPTARTPTPEEWLAQAQRALQRGVPRADVEKRLRENGIDPAGLR